MLTSEIASFLKEEMKIKFVIGQIIIAMIAINEQIRKINLNLGSEEVVDKTFFLFTASPQ